MTPGFAFVDAPLDRADELRGDAAALDALRGDAACLLLDALGDARPTVDQPDDDPYLWLEEIEGERALAWVEAENERTLKAFAGAQFAADRDTLAAAVGTAQEAFRCLDDGLRA